MYVIVLQNGSEYVEHRILSSITHGGPRPHRYMFIVYRQLHMDNVIMQAKRDFVSQVKFLECKAP